MNFFRSILSDDPDISDPEKPLKSEAESNSDQRDSDSDEKEIETETYPGSGSNHNVDTSNDTASDIGWSFGGLMKTLATRSESVLETYRRDLKEFSSGLKKETKLFREVASRAVKDLPASIEAGASVAHGSFESVGYALDGVLKSTVDVISQGKESLLAPSEGDSETPDLRRNSNSGRYSWFDVQLNALQNDMNTFTEDPEDSDDYKKWKAEFALVEKSAEMENLIGDNGDLETIYKKVVPGVVDRETFWFRYFYKVHKLKQQESVRANLVRRAISIDDEEELSWDVDDDEDDSNNTRIGKQDINGKPKADEPENKNSDSVLVAETPKKETAHNESKNLDSEVGSGKADKETNVDSIDKSCSVSNEKSRAEERLQGKTEETEVKSETVSLEKKGDGIEAGKDSNASVVATKHSLSEEEEDLGWDEIEDIGSMEEKKEDAARSNPDPAGLRKRLTVTEEDEDLSWDIEDDDEPVKS